jgi:hypothetical protein
MYVKTFKTDTINIGNIIYVLTVSLGEINGKNVQITDKY